MANPGPSKCLQVNIIDIVKELKESFLDKPQTLKYLATMEELVTNTHPELLMLGFINQSKKWEKSYEEGDYFKILEEFLNEHRLAVAGKLSEEIKLDQLSDDDKDVYIEYLKSFFRLKEQYLKGNASR
jgi:hypothetical protein